MEFESFGKIPRLSREIIITEKIDGTNAQIAINDDGTVQAGSRTRWITPEADNFGFAAWVKENEEELRLLGPGRHFGEWWGRGIQRGYGLNERRFSLFNSSRWSLERPACCNVVPVLYQGPWSELEINDCLNCLNQYGSAASRGFMNPEGIVLFHTKSRQMYKKTLVGDDSFKGEL